MLHALASCAILLEEVEGKEVSRERSYHLSLSSRDHHPHSLYLHMSWETYSGFVPLDEWLAQFRPSVISQHQVAWLHVENAATTKKTEDFGNHDAALGDWLRYVPIYLSLFSSLRSLILSSPHLIL